MTFLTDYLLTIQMYTLHNYVVFLFYSKLQSDLKTTKIEELKQQMEVFVNEIHRLQNSKDTGVDKSARYCKKVILLKIFDLCFFCKCPIYLNIQSLTL